MKKTKEIWTKDYSSKTVFRRQIMNKWQQLLYTIRITHQWGSCWWEWCVIPRGSSLCILGEERSLEEAKKAITRVVNNSSTWKIRNVE